ncbi:putative isoflavone reductase family protein CipA [Aspergillus sclerotioniger CBS 115572]|uniref:Putative isoflavone reductase family protein CipA n=1 Tax=Aspergillus sclerotioniger CBS 115572 TaxID=1450535 RepID=A0A317VPJ5_9EURO|nr:putative isoflavone reductase family protein CipA [Aspergillus sclerotioniger CBS 115572]PWY75191.1 putative isoflavone reductase family protein CipA [Aspergillus sclerotioniger CBS 115572]
MSRTIKNVAIAGASGNVGARVLSALIDLKFNVTVLTRSSKSFPSTVQVKVVNFDSLESLSAAIAGQDAVIDTTFSLEIETPLRLIHAAAENGVYRFITSDFGLDPDLPGVHDMPVFARKKASYEAVKRHAAENRLTYTLVACGAFLDWGISSGFAGLDMKGKKAFIFGDGNNVVPWTTIDEVGVATAHVLLHPQETLNRPVYVHSVFMSQNQLLATSKAILGADGWETTYNDMDQLFKNALADLEAGNISTSTFEVQIQYCLATKALAHPWARDDNLLLGLKGWEMEKVEGLVQTIVQEAAQS